MKLLMSTLLRRSALDCYFQKFKLCVGLVNINPKQYYFLTFSDEMLKSLSPTSRADSNKQLANLKEHESIVLQYKDLIQEQVSCVDG